MPKSHRAALAAGTAVLIAAAAAVDASAATAPTAKTYGGATATLYASGLKNVTSFAWGDGAMFAGDSGNSQKLPNGGVYVVKDGKGTLIPQGPLFVAGLAFHGGALYVSGASLVNGAPAFQIQRWSGFTGSTFTTRTVIYTAPAKFQGFNGIAFGPDGRLYVGANVGLFNGNDHGPASGSPYLYDLLSMRSDGTDLKVFASGIRQPWQIAFAAGSAHPFVSDLGQDGPATIKNPPDFLLKVKRGDNYGFPRCNWTKGSDCTGDAKPFAFFTPHTDIMGIAPVGKRLYFGSFQGIGGKGGGALYEMPVAGGTPKAVVTGFPAATDALAAHDGVLYVGGSTQKGVGVIYRVKP